MGIPHCVVQDGYNTCKIELATWFVVEEWTLDEFHIFPFNSELAARTKFSQCQMRIPSVLYKGKYEVDCDKFGKNDLGEIVRNDIRKSFNKWFMEHMSHYVTPIYNEDEKLCCVCHDKPNNYVFIPCLHKICCMICSLRIFGSSKNYCPLCKKKIENIYEY